jgi:hypothetical protein
MLRKEPFKSLGYRRFLLWGTDYLISRMAVGVCGSMDEDNRLNLNNKIRAVTFINVHRLTSFKKNEYRL